MVFIIASIIAWLLKDVVQKCIPLSLLGLLFACFVTNSTVLLPASSLILVIEYSYILNPLWVVIFGTLGAVIGELVGYMVGVEGRNYLNCKFVKWITINFEKKEFLWVVIFSIIPLPVFDVIGIIAGRNRMNPFKFFVACYVGKCLKFSSYICVLHFLNNIVEGGF